VQRTTERLAAALAVALGVLLVAQGDTPLAFAAGVAFAAVVAVAATSVLAARYAAIAMRSRNIGGLHRGWVRRQRRRATPEPQHPHTAGRRRSRAPSQRLLAA
jgi:hypothetical protein